MQFNNYLINREIFAHSINPSHMSDWPLKKQEILEDLSIFVDLGLPSGTLWSSVNIGASSPEEYGDYFAWGETSEKKECGPDNYMYAENPEILPPAYDAATCTLGEEFRMPTKEEAEELVNECAWTVVEYPESTEISVYKVEGKNGNCIYLPFAGGSSTESTNTGQEEIGLYWTSSIDTEDDTNAYYLSAYSTVEVESNKRWAGLVIRPVKNQ